MQCKDELEKLAAYMNDFVAMLPASVRADAGNRAAVCINNIAQALSIYEEPKDAPTKE